MKSPIFGLGKVSFEVEVGQLDIGGSRFYYCERTRVDGSALSSTASNRKSLDGR